MTGGKLAGVLSRSGRTLAFRPDLNGVFGGYRAYYLGWVGSSGYIKQLQAGRCSLYDLKYHLYYCKVYTHVVPTLKYHVVPVH